MSAVIDKPSTALGHVRLGNRTRGSGPSFHWYTAGKMAAWRSDFMRDAREKKRQGKDWAVASAVANARYYHHECLREIARALKLS